MDIDFTRPTAIILGNEHRGMDPDVKVHVPDEIYIPMFGMVQSLNVSVAAATILYEAMRQRRAAGMYDADLSGRGAVRGSIRGLVQARQRLLSGAQPLECIWLEIHSARSFG